MPGMDGMTTTAAIRKQETAANKHPTPVIALTAYSLDGKQDKIQASGMNGYLMKPVSEHELQATIYKWTESSAKKPEPSSKQQQLARELLPMLAASLPEEIASIYQSYAELDFEKLRDHLHRLQGGCCYCDVPNLLAAVKELSRAAAEPTVDSNKIKQCLTKLLLESQKVMQQVAVVA